MKQTAVEKLIRGHHEIFGVLFLNLEQQEKLTKLYDECFELQKQQSLELIELTTQLKSVSTANWRVAEIECINIYNHYYNDVIIPKEEPKQETLEDFVIENGERIAQLIIAKHERAEWKLQQVYSEEKIDKILQKLEEIKIMINIR